MRHFSSVAATRSAVSAVAQFLLFLPRDAMLARSRVSDCHKSVLLKRLNVGLHKQQHDSPRTLFFVLRISAKHKSGNPNGGAKCRLGMLKLAAFDK